MTNAKRMFLIVFALYVMHQTCFEYFLNSAIYLCMYIFAYVCISTFTYIYSNIYIYINVIHVFSHITSINSQILN